MLRTPAYLFATLAWLGSYTRAIDAWFYSGDDCEPWNKTLSSGARSMDSSTCNKGQLHDGEGDVGPRKQVWLPYKPYGEQALELSGYGDSDVPDDDELELFDKQLRTYCLIMSSEAECSDCMQTYKDITLGQNPQDEGCVPLPEGRFDSFKFVSDECAVYIRENNCPTPTDSYGMPRHTF